MFAPKDFVLTAEGLVFAVLTAGLEEGRILAFLRYRQTPEGLLKLSTQAANDLLASQFPHYLFYSALRDTHCHGVPSASVQQHYQPQQKLQSLYAAHTQADPALEACGKLVKLLAAQGLDMSQAGVTGSLLLDAQHADSDIDLVIYDRQVFQQLREIVQALIAQNQLQALAIADWQNAYERRTCSLSFADYCWHEQRKFNKAMINGIKVDFSLISADLPAETVNYKKLGLIKRQFKILQADLAFDHPAVWVLDDPVIRRLECFTATYSGQAFAGEWVEVSGQLEAADSGEQRIIVGASREAPGEYIKVIAHVETH